MFRFFTFVMFLTGLAAAGTPEEEGYAIAKKADAIFRGYGDETASAVLYLINANKDTVVRKTRSLTLERPNWQDYSLIQFMDPPDVRGTSLLTHQNPSGEDKQWLYLPELRRVKKISSSNKSGSFMGSEFTYEDITSNTLEKFSYKKIGEEKLNGLECFVIEKFPKYKKSGYNKIKMWISKANYLPYRNEFTDRKNSLLKVQTFKNYEKHPGGKYRIGTLIMENLQTGKKSIFTFHDRKLGVGLKESDFTKRSLQRIVNR